MRTATRTIGLIVGIGLLLADAAPAADGPTRMPPLTQPTRYVPKLGPPHTTLPPWQPASHSAMQPATVMQPATAMHPAQTVRTAAVDSVITPTITLAAYDEPTDASFQPPVLPDELTAKSQLRRPARPVWSPDSVFGSDPAWKPSFIKGGRAAVSYNPGSEQGLDWTTVDVLVGLQRPGGRAFSITPHFAASFTDGVHDEFLQTPTGVSDLPSTFYAASVDIGAGLPLSPIGPDGPEWLLIGAISPGLFTDGSNTSSDAFRTPGRLLLLWNASPEWTWSLGAVYLDREDVPILPAVGAVWKPTPNLRLDLIMPRPRAAYRFQQRPDLERWATFSGELAGGQWAIERTIVDDATGDVARVDDVVRIKGSNVLFGIETRQATGWTWRTEFGFVVGREIDYESGRGNQELDAAAIVRFGSSF